MTPSHHQPKDRLTEDNDEAGLPSFFILPAYSLSLMFSSSANNTVTGRNLGASVCSSDAQPTCVYLSTLPGRPSFCLRVFFSRLYWSGMFKTAVSHEVPTTALADELLDHHPRCLKLSQDGKSEPSLRGQPKYTLGMYDRRCQLVL